MKDKKKDIRIPVNLPFIRNLLVVLIGILVLLNLVHLVVKHAFVLVDRMAIRILVWFDLNQEAGIATLFSFLLILSCCFSLFLIHLREKNESEDWRRWRLLSFIFLYLAVDELWALHEGIMKVIRKFIITEGIFYYSWIIPYSVATITLMVYFWGFLQRLPKRSRNNFIIAGVIFIAGAVGMEMLGGLYHSTQGNQALAYGLLYTGEELLEMTGMGFFLYSLILHIKDQYQGMTIQVSFPAATSRENKTSLPAEGHSQRHRKTRKEKLLGSIPADRTDKLGPNRL